MSGTVRVGVAAVATAALVGWLSPAGTGSPLARVVPALVAGLVVVGVGWWSLRTGRHTPWRAASSAVESGRVVVLWKPGCPYCERLLLVLGRRHDVVWVNVWRDEEANRVVRSLNGGDELVPTVLVAGEVLRNPSPQHVRSRLTKPEA